MAKNRFPLLWLMLLLPILVPLQAADVRLERLGVWGNDGYRFIESGPHGLYGLTSHSLDFLEIGEGGQPRVAGSVFIDDYQIHGLQADGEFLWIATTNSIQLVQLGANQVTPLLRFTPSVRTSIWAGDRGRLVVRYRDMLRYYRANDEGDLALERELAWPENITQLALLGDDLIVQGDRQIYVLALSNGDRQSALPLDVPGTVTFANGGLAVMDQTVFAVDQTNKTLSRWVRDPNAWTTQPPVPINDANDQIFVRHLDAHYIVLGNDYDMVWAFERRDDREPLFVRAATEISHDDVLPLGADDWFVGNRMGLQRWIADEDGMSVSARIAQGGSGGDLVIKGSVIYWVKGDAAWLFDRRDPFNPTPLGTLQTGPVHQLRLEGNVLAVVGDVLSLYNVSNPFEPQLLSTLPISFAGVAMQERLLVGFYFDYRADRGHLQLYNLSNAAEPQLLHELTDQIFFKDVALSGDQVFGLGYSDVYQYQWHADAARLEKVAQVYTGTGHVEHDNFTVRDGQVLTYWSSGNLMALDYDENTALRPTVNTYIAGGSLFNASRLDYRNGLVAVGGKDLVVVDTNTPHQLEEIGRLTMAGVRDTAWLGNLLFVSSGGSGRLEVVRLKQVVPPIYFPWISNSPDYPSDLTVVNEGPLAQTLTFTAMLRNAPAQTITRTVPGDSAQVWSVESLFPGHTGYSLKVASESQKVQAFLQRRDRQGSVVQPAVLADKAGTDLVFPAFQGAAALRVIVVTPLRTGSSPLLARIEMLRSNGSRSGEFPAFLRPGEPNVVFLPEGDFRFRVAVEQEVPLLGEQFHFDSDGGHASVLGWSAGADSAMRAPLTVHHQWVNPDAKPWRAMASSFDRVALADAKSVKVLGARLTGLYEQASIDGFDDIRDLTWGDNYLVVADSQGVFIYDVDDFGTVTELAQIQQDKIVQIEVSRFPNRHLMVGFEVGFRYGNWHLYDWSEPGKLQRIAEGDYGLPQRFSFERGFFSFFEPYQEVIILDMRNAPTVTTEQRLYHQLLVDAGNHQTIIHGNQVLWLHPHRGLYSLYRPWFPDYSQAYFGFSPLFQAEEMAVMEDAVLVADRTNGLKLVDITNPFDLQTVDHFTDLKTNLVAADADRLWAADQSNGDVRYLLRGTPQPQWHVPHLATDLGVLYLEYHRRLADLNYLHWTADADAGLIPIAESIGTIAVDSLAGDGPHAALSFTADMPTAAWLHGGGLRWVPTVRDHELGSALVVPLLGEQTPRVTLMHGGVADEIRFTLFLADGTEVTQALGIDAAPTTTFTLSELFEPEQLALAKALRLEASEDARFSAAVHLLQSGTLSQLIPATRVR